MLWYMSIVTTPLWNCLDNKVKVSMTASYDIPLTLAYRICRQSRIQFITISKWDLHHQLIMAITRGELEYSRNKPLQWRGDAGAFWSIRDNILKYAMSLHSCQMVLLLFVILNLKTPCSGPQLLRYRVYRPSYIYIPYLRHNKFTLPALQLCIRYF